MKYYTKYESKLGLIIMTFDKDSLISLTIEGQKPEDLKKLKENSDLEIIKKSVDWLDRYFRKEKPKPDALKLNLKGTSFQKEVWSYLLKIEYGSYLSYGEIAEMIAAKRSLSKFSAQAVGRAVGANPISIILPCHRVMGKKGNLTGYQGGVKLKLKLLEHEEVNTEGFYYKEQNETKM